MDRALQILSNGLLFILEWPPRVFVVGLKLHVATEPHRHLSPPQSGRPQVSQQDLSLLFNDLS
jgi:hypothetical protein